MTTGILWNKVHILENTDNSFDRRLFEEKLQSHLDGTNKAIADHVIFIRDEVTQMQVQHLANMKEVKKLVTTDLESLLVTTLKESGEYTDKRIKSLNNKFFKVINLDS